MFSTSHRTAGVRAGRVRRPSAAARPFRRGAGGVVDRLRGVGLGFERVVDETEAPGEQLLSFPARGARRAGADLLDLPSLTPPCVGFRPPDSPGDHSSGARRAVAAAPRDVPARSRRPVRCVRRTTSARAGSTRACSVCYAGTVATGPALNPVSGCTVTVSGPVAGMLESVSRVARVLVLLIAADPALTVTK